MRGYKTNNDSGCRSDLKSENYSCDSHYSTADLLYIRNHCSNYFIRSDDRCWSIYRNVCDNISSFSIFMLFSCSTIPIWNHMWSNWNADILYSSSLNSYIQKHSSKVFNYVETAKLAKWWCWHKRSRANEQCSDIVSGILMNYCKKIKESSTSYYW